MKRRPKPAAAPAAPLRRIVPQNTLARQAVACCHEKLDGGGSAPELRGAAEASRDRYAARLAAAGFGAVTTEILDAPEFYYAEDYHQQYLHKNPGGYCGLGGTGVSCPVGVKMGAAE